MIAVVSLQQTPPEPVQPKPSRTFDVVHVYLDVADAALAAYQIDVGAATGEVTVVGVEGGEHPEFATPPYYDDKAIQNERVVIGAFSTADAGTLPTGRVRVATIHVQLKGEDVTFESDLQVVATVGGKSIEAEVSLVRGSES
jgi:hypothetical protein